MLLPLGLIRQRWPMPKRAWQPVTSLSISLSGELTGFDVAVANAIYDKLGERLTLNQYDWDNVVSLLRYGELHIAIGMENQRAAAVLFV